MKPAPTTFRTGGSACWHERGREATLLVGIALLSGDPHLAPLRGRNYLLYALLAVGWAVCAGVLVFNCLDVSSFGAHPLLVGKDVEEVMGLCRALAGEVELVRGYLADDFTVVMRRGSG